MTGRVQGKVALITGGGRGQGRSHALKLAAEGADIVAFDLCHDLKSVAYDLATPDDLKQTVAEVEALDRRALGIQGDVRDLNALTDAVKATIDTFGKLDIVCANAGIASFVPGLGMEGWAEVAGTNLVGVMNTLHATLPAMSAGGSAIVTGSFAAMIKGGIGGSRAGWPTATPSGSSSTTSSGSRPRRRCRASGSTGSTRPTSTPACCTTTASTPGSGPTWRTRPARMSCPRSPPCS